MAMKKKTAAKKTAAKKTAAKKTSAPRSKASPASDASATSAIGPLEAARDEFVDARNEQAKQSRELHLLYNDLRQTFADLEKTRQAITDASNAHDAEIRRHLGELGASRQVLASAATRAESDARTSGGSPSTGPALLIVITVLLVISLIVGVSALLKVGSLETKITDLQAQIEPGTTARTDDELPAGNEK